MSWLTILGCFFALGVIALLFRVAILVLRWGYPIHLAFKIMWRENTGGKHD